MFSKIKKNKKNPYKELFSFLWHYTLISAVMYIMQDQQGVFPYFIYSRLYLCVLWKLLMLSLEFTMLKKEKICEIYMKQEVKSAWSAKFNSTKLFLHLKKHILQIWSQLEKEMLNY